MLYSSQEDMSFFEFVVAKISNVNMHVCNEFDSCIIRRIKNIIGSWPDKNTKASNFSNVMVKAVLFDNRLGKKTFRFKKGYVFSISSSVRGIL